MSITAWVPGAQLEAAAVRVEARLHRGGISHARRFAARTESRAIVAAAIAFVMALAGALVGYWGRAVPVWDGASVGVGSIVATTVAGLAAATVSYRLAAADPRQAWLRGVPLARRACMTAAVAVSLTAILGLIEWMLFRAGELIWPDVTVDTLTASMITALIAAASAYGSFVLASRVSPTMLVLLLLAVVATGFVVSVATSKDDGWYRLNFSELGGRGGVSATVFNSTLVLASAVAAMLAIYVHASLRNLARIEPRLTRARVLITYIVFLAFACCFLGAAAIPVNVSQLGHNLFAVGMAVIFVLLMLSLPWLLPWLPRATRMVGLAVVVGLVFSETLFWTSYYTLTTHEMIGTALVVGWLLLFTRTMAVMERAAAEEPAEDSPHVAGS